MNGVLYSSIILDDILGVGEVLFARKFSDEAKDIVIRLDQIIREKEAKKNY